MPKILYIQYANPAAFPPVEYSSRILADVGFDVKFLGVHSQGSESLEFREHHNISAEIWPYVSPGYKQKLAYLKFIKRCIGLARSWKPDWIYISDFMAAPAGVLLSRYFGFKVVYHEHDSQIRSPHDTVFVRQMMAARRSLANYAEFNILPQQDRISLFKKHTGTQRPVLRVWNCPQYADTLSAQNRQRQPKEPLAVYFHGSINLERVSLALVQGAGLSGVPVRLRVVGYETIGSRGSCDALRAAAVAAGDQVTLELPGPISRHELVKQMEGMHVGWINFANYSKDVNLKHMLGASNKGFDYLANCMPLMVPRADDWEACFVSPGYAKSCDPHDAAGIADVLRWYYGNPKEAAAMGQAGQRRVQEEWNYEKQFAPVLDLLKRGCRK